MLNTKNILNATKIMAFLLYSDKSLSFKYYFVTNKKINIIEKFYVEILTYVTVRGSSNSKQQ